MPYKSQFYSNTGVDTQHLSVLHLLHSFFGNVFQKVGIFSFQYCVKFWGKFVCLALGFLVWTLVWTLSVFSMITKQLCFNITGKRAYDSTRLIQQHFGV